MNDQTRALGAPIELAIGQPIGYARGEKDSHRKVKRTKLANMKAQNYDSSPPACVNCDHFKPGEWGRAGRPTLGARRFIDPICRLGGFKVKSHCICDCWKRGADDLEPAADDAAIKEKP